MRDFFMLITFLVILPNIFMENVLVIYSSVLYNDFSEYRQSNSTLHITFQKIDNKPNLNDLVKYKYHKQDVIMSFTPWSNLLSHILKNERNVYIPFSLSYYNLDRHLERHGIQVCEEYHWSFVSLMQTLLDSVLVKRVAFIAPDDSCSKYRIKKLKSKVKEKVKHLNFGEFFYESSLDTLGEFRRKLVMVRSFSVGVIILLAPSNHYQFVFQEAFLQNLLSSHYMWLIPAYRNNGNYLREPSKVLSFYSTDVTKYRSIRNGLHCVFDFLNGKRLHEIENSKSELYQNFLSGQHDTRNGFKFTLRYREGIGPWLETQAIYEGGVIMDEDEIPFVRALVGKTEHVHQTLKVVTVFDKPFTIEDYGSLNQNFSTCSKGMICKKPVTKGDKLKYVTTCCTGYVIDIFELIMKQLHMGVELYIVADGRYGGYSRETKSWDGMIGDIVRGKADVAIAGLTITAARSEVVDFTVAYSESTTGILDFPKESPLNFVNWEFMAPLSAWLQLALWFIVLGFMGVVYLLENTICFFSILKKSYVKERYYSMLESISYVSGVFLQRDLGGESPKRPGSRVAAVFFAFGMVIVVTTYTAVLAATHMQKEEKNPFLGLDDTRMKNPRESFKFATIKSSSYEEYFERSTNDVIKRMGIFMKPYNVETTDEGVQKIRNGTLQAFIDDYEFLNYNLQQEDTCDLRVTEDNMYSTGLGFALGKNVKIKPLLNQIILHHRENEDFLEIKKRWFVQLCLPKIFAKTTSPLTINHFGGIILVLIVTAVISAPLIYPETLYYNHFENFINLKLKELIGRLTTRKSQRRRQNEISFIEINGNSLNKHKYQSS